MSDLGELFKAWDDHKKEVKAKRLESTSDEGWSKHTTYHWFRFVDGNKVDFWPSTGMCMYKGKRRNINSKFMKNLIKQGER